MKLSDIAPRLAKARDQHVRFEQQNRAERRFLRNRIMRAEWLVAHRDLQLQRAFATGKRKYIRHREKKLKEAYTELERINTKLEEVLERR